ncbi:MAG TPA: tetratricopeptide repeat protein, partial [Blastocatellia bacterium]
IPTRLDPTSSTRSLAYQAPAASPYGTEITQIAAPRPAQPGGSSRSGRKWPLAAGALGLLLAGTAAGAILFSGVASPEPSPQNASAKTETPTPTLAPSASPAPSPAALKAKPAPTIAKPAPPPVEEMNYKLAENLERQERYAEAARLYEDYLARNPNAPDAKVVMSYRDGLKRIQDALADADSAMNARRYPLAIKHYQRALMLRPDSRRAKDGLEEAAERLRDSLPLRMRRESPAGQNEFPRGGRQRRPEDQYQDPPERMFRRPRPAPTPRNPEP